MPALVVLERFPVPVAAVGPDGDILFANSAFAAMLGYSPADAQQLRFDDIFQTVPADESAVDVVRGHADLIVDLRHSDGSTVRAQLSKSALLRDDDDVALAVFQDVTEQLWLDEV